MQKFKAYRTFQENDAVVSRFVEMTAGRARSRRRRGPDQVLDDQLQGRAVVQRRRQDHAQVPDQRRHRHGGHRRIVARHAVEARRQGHRARLRHGRRARRRLQRIRPRARRLGGAAAREHDGVRRDDARHGRLHRGAGDHADGAQRAQARQRSGGRDRRDGRRGLGGGRDPGQDRLSRRRDHRQAGGSALPEGAGREGGAAATGDRAREDPPARQVDVGRAPSTIWAATCSRGCCRR